MNQDNESPNNKSKYVSEHIIKGHFKKFYGYEWKVDDVFEYPFIVKKKGISSSDNHNWINTVFPDINVQESLLYRRKVLDNIIEELFLLLLDADDVEDTGTSIWVNYQYVNRIGEHIKLFYLLPYFNSYPLISEDGINLPEIENRVIIEEVEEKIQSLVEYLIDDDISIIRKRISILMKKLNENFKDFQEKYIFMYFDDNAKKIEIFFNKLLDLVDPDTALFNNIKELIYQEIDTESCKIWNTHFIDKNITSLEDQKNYLALALITDVSNIFDLSKDDNCVFNIYSLTNIDLNIKGKHLFGLFLDMTDIPDYYNYDFNVKDVRGNKVEYYHVEKTYDVCIFVFDILYLIDQRISGVKITFRSKDKKYESLFFNFDFN